MPPSIARRILVAEDEGLIALQLEELLSSLDYQVVGPCASVEDVMSAIDTDAFDGALLDVNLRGKPVFPVLPRLMQMKKPFIITSGYHAPSLFPPEYRDVPRVGKPFDETKLRQLCGQIFR